MSGYVNREQKYQYIVRDIEATCLPARRGTIEVISSLPTCRGSNDKYKQRIYMNCREVSQKIATIKSKRESFDRFFEEGDIVNSTNLKKEIEGLIEALLEEFTVTIEKAKELIGVGNFFGLEEAKKAFDVDLKEEQIPKIPFSAAELERARELDQILILRIGRDTKGNFLALETMAEAELYPKFHGSDWCKDETFMYRGINTQWALVSKNFVSNSDNKKNYLEQTELLVAHLKEVVFEDQAIPRQLQKAIDQFEEYMRMNFEGKSKAEIKEKMEMILDNSGEPTSLLVNQLCRQTPVEAVYDSTVYMLNTGKELMLPNEYLWSNDVARKSNVGHIIAISNYTINGIEIYRYAAHKERAHLGTIFARTGWKL